MSSTTISYDEISALDSAGTYIVALPAGAKYVPGVGSTIDAGDQI